MACHGKVLHEQKQQKEKFFLILFYPSWKIDMETKQS